MAIHRLTLLLSALVFAVPAAAQFSIDTVSYHGVSHASHQSSHNSLQPQGYRLTSLTVAGGWANSHYSAVWVRQGGPAWVTSHGMTLAQFTTQRNTWVLQGYRAKIVSASGAGSDKVFAAVFVNDGLQVVSSIDLSRASFDSTLYSQREAGRRLSCCAVYGTAAVPLFAPVFEPDDSDIGWGCAVSSAADYNAHFAQYELTEARPWALATSDSQLYVSIWRDDRIGAWAGVSGRTLAQFSADKAAMAAQGLVPLCIAASGSGSSARFGGFFVERLSSLPRTLTHTSLALPAMQPIDAVMDQFVQAHNVRNATLAVTRNGRLAYARGYGYAEAGHPATLPSARFRIGSIAKAMTGMLTHQLIQEGTGNLTLNTGFVNYLNINTYSTGSLNVNVQRLLNHSAGLNDPPYADEMVVAQWWNASNPQLPCDESVIGRWVIANTNTNLGQYSYSNAGATMVGQMIEHAANSTYLTALNNRLGAPLDVTFVRQRPLQTQLVAGEPHYFAHNLNLRAGNLYTDLRLMAPPYCQSFWDAAGGLVCSAVDLARIMAGSFQIGADSPVFTTATQADMLVQRTMTNRGGSGSSTVTDSSWHVSSLSGGRTMYWHNGAQDGFYTLAYFRTDGVGIVVFTNSNSGMSGTALSDAADQVISWPTTDLFPGYGMPSFPRSPTLTTPTVGTVPNLSHSPFVLRGSNLDQVTNVRLGGTHILLPGSTWQNGYIELVSPTTLNVFPPQGLFPTSYTLQAYSAQGGSNIINVTLSRAPAFAVVAPDSVLGPTMPLPVFVAQGQLPSTSFIVLGISPSALPSVVPGIVSMGIGNQLTAMLVSDTRQPNLVTGAIRWDLPGLGGWNEVFLQAAALVPNSINPFPLPTTGVVRVFRR